MHLRQRAISEGEGRLLQRVTPRFSGSSDVPARRAKGKKYEAEGEEKRE